MSSTELTPDMIRSVQQTLAQDGSYRGRIDGVWGPQTEAAVRDYQQQHNLNPSGRLDRDTLAAMNLASTQGNPQERHQQYGSNYSAPLSQPKAGMTR